MTSLPPLVGKPSQQVDNGVKASSAAANQQERSAAPSTPVEEEDTTAAALAALRERLPPIKVPVPPVVKLRPTPPALAYPKHRSQPAAAGRPRKQQQQADVDKLAKLLDKGQAQARSVLEATEQHVWTRLLLAHLHEMALLEDSVLHRESSGRDALRREEDRSFALTFVVEHDARLHRISSRDLVGVQLRKHVMAVDQDDGRKAVVAQEAAEFAQLQHREVIYRPVPTAVDPHQQRHKTRRPIAATTSTARNVGGGNVRHPAPPPESRSVNSARTEDRFVANGRLMWGQQKVYREQQHRADAAVAAAIPSEQLRREEIEGAELGERLALERRFFNDHHVAVKQAAENRTIETKRLLAVEEAHCAAARQAVELVMNHVIDTTAGTLPFDVYVEPVTTLDGPQTVPRKTTSSSALSANRSLGHPVEKESSSWCQDDQLLIAPQPTRSRRSSSIVKKTAGPKDQEGVQRLLAAVKQDLAAAQQASQQVGSTSLLTPMELVTLVDSANQRLFPAVGGALNEWKYSGIATLRLATTAQNEQQPPGATTSRHDDNDDDATAASTGAVVAPTVVVSDQEAAEDALTPPVEVTHQGPLSALPAANAQPPMASGRPLFPGIDVLCDVMLDVTDIDNLTPWKMFLSAVLDIEDEMGADASQRCPYVKRLYDGHRAAVLNRDYLEHVLWRTDLHHRNVVNALELMPTRWTSYRNPREFEDEEVEEIVVGEVIAREKVVRQQVNEFCSFLHYAQVKLMQLDQRRP